MSTSSILAWLDKIPAEAQPSDQEDAGPAKRRRLNPPTPDPSTSPTMSGSVARDTSPGKRKGRADPGTPSSAKRARDLRSEVNLPPSEISATGSGRLSPTKQFQLYKMQPNGPDFKDLSQLSNKPKPLRTLLAKIDNVMDGFRIISPAQKSELEAAAEKYNGNFD